jgi:hypothetical protein
MWALHPACDRGCRYVERNLERRRDRGDESGKGDRHGSHGSDQALRVRPDGQAEPCRQSESRNHRYPSH